MQVPAETKATRPDEELTVQTPVVELEYVLVPEPADGVEVSLVAWGRIQVEEIAFTAPDRSGEGITIDAGDVQDRVGHLVKNADLSKFIL